MAPKTQRANKAAWGLVVQSMCYCLDEVLVSKHNIFWVCLSLMAAKAGGAKEVAKKAKKGAAEVFEEVPSVTQESSLCQASLGQASLGQA